MRATKYAPVLSPHLLFPDELIQLTGVNAGAGAAWFGANTAIYIPVMFPVDVVVNGTKFDCTSGNLSGRNFDAGFFDAATNVKLSSSGSTLVAAGVNTWAASQALTGGVRYFFGLSLNSVSLLLWRAAPSTNNLRVAGVAKEASAFPLPATATPTVVTSAYFPMVTFTFANLP